MTDIYSVKVKTHAAQVSVAVQTDRRLIVSVHAAPEKGKANEAVRRVLAGHFKVPLRCIEIIHGQTSDKKMIRVLDAE